MSQAQGTKYQTYRNELPRRPPELWDGLQRDILRMDTPSLSGNRYAPLTVDRASKFLSGFALETTRAIGVARVLA